MKDINDINSKTSDQDCLSGSGSGSGSDADADADADASDTNQTQTQTQTQTHILLNKRYEELRTQILELGPLVSLESHSPLSTSKSTSSETQWWEQWERKSGQIGEEFNIITQQGMASWLEVWLELKPIIRAGACDGDRNIDNTHTDTAGDVNVSIGAGAGTGIGTGTDIGIGISTGAGTGRGRGTGRGTGTGTGAGCTGSIENKNLYKIRNSDMILDYPGALVGVLSDMVLNAVSVAHLNNK